MRNEVYKYKIYQCIKCVIINTTIIPTVMLNSKYKIKKIIYAYIGIKCKQIISQTSI